MLKNNVINESDKLLRQILKIVVHIFGCLFDTMLSYYILFDHRLLDGFGYLILILFNFAYRNL